MLVWGDIRARYQTSPATAGLLPAVAPSSLPDSEPKDSGTAQCRPKCPRTAERPLRGHHPRRRIRGDPAGEF